MNNCKNCHAPEGERVFRHEDGTNWTQSFDLVSEDLAYSAKATIIYLDKDGKCNKCREKK